MTVPGPGGHAQSPPMSGRLAPMGSAAGDAVDRAAQEPLLASHHEGLHVLATDLRNAPLGSLTNWYDVELASLYSPHDVVAPTSRLTRVGDFLAILAGFGIFVPLLITWDGIRSASATYSDLLAQNQLTAGSSFFSLWMSGFGGRTTTFAQTALLTFSTLLLVAVTYTTARIMQVTGEGRAARREAAARAQLSEALILAQRTISEARYGDQSSAYAQVLATAEAARQSSEEARKLLGAVRTAANKSQALFDQHVGLVDAGAQRLESATAVMATAVDHMRDALSTLQTESAQRSSDLADAHDRLGKTLTDFDDAAQRRYESSTREGAAAMQALAKSLASSQGAVHAALADNAADTQKLVAAASAQIGTDLGSALRQVADQMTRLTEALSEMRDNYLMVAGAGQSHVEALEDLARDLSRAVNGGSNGHNP